ncbi:MAG: diguanylate cyclase [Longimicrobiales bacterium]|nr:diguanylate cyclase [Longimicrobiales bacterium]
MAIRQAGKRQRGDAQASPRSLHPGAAGRPPGWVDRLDAGPDPVAFAINAIVLGTIAAVHATTDAPLGFGFLYLGPVAWVAWRWGWFAGVLWAVVAALLWLVAEPAGTPVVVVWNLAVQTAALLAAAFLVAGLRQERDAVRTLAGTDHQTGVHNPHAFRELVELERSRALRYDRPFTLAYMDVDGFRRINREWGHTAGDQALRMVATTIRENIRSMDSVARMGGDEFALLFPETGKGAAGVALHKIQSRLLQTSDDRSLSLGFTIGAVICVGAPESVDDLIQRAEALMYAAKEDGGSGIRTEVLDGNFGIEAILQRG